MLPGGEFPQSDKEIPKLLNTLRGLGMYGSFSEMGEPLLGAPESGALYGPQCFNNGDSHGKENWQ